MAQEPLRLVHRSRVETVVVADADTHGIMRGKRLPIADLLERSGLARDWLGDDAVEHCVAMRRAEVAAQAAAVTDGEIERSLEAR